MSVNWNWKALLLGVALVLPVAAHADEDLDKALTNSDNWAAQAGDNYNHRYSALICFNAL